MFKRIFFIGILLALPLRSLSQTVAALPVQQCINPGVQASTSNLLSTNYLMGVVPSCTVTLYNTGTTTLATYYTSIGGSPLSGPFTASPTGQFLVYVSNAQGYDVAFSGGIPPNTYPQTVTLVGIGALGGGGGSAGGPTTSVQVNVGGVFTGYANLTYTPSGGLQIGPTSTGHTAHVGFAGSPPADWYWYWDTPQTAAASLGLNACHAIEQIGADAGAQIQACANLQPALIDATGYSGTVTISENILASITVPTVIQFGRADYKFTVPQTVSTSYLNMQGSGTVFDVDFASGDFITYPNGGTADHGSFNDINIKPFAGITRTSGNFIVAENSYSNFQNIVITDPLNGFFIFNSQGSVFKNIRFLTTTTGTLNYGMFVYGTDIDNDFDDIYMLSSFSVADAMVHFRNRISGVTWEGGRLIASGGAANGTVLFDCDAGGSTSTSIASSTACTDAWSGIATNRPEISRFVNMYVEGGASSAANADVVIKGGQDLKFSNGYFASGLQAFKISAESSGIMVESSLLGPSQNQCVLDTAVSATGNGYATLSLVNNSIGPCSNSSNNAFADVELGSGTSNVRITGNHLGNGDAFANFSFNEKYGVLLDGTNNFINITGNDFTSIIGGISPSLYTIFNNGTPGAYQTFVANVGVGVNSPQTPDQISTQLNFLSNLKIATAAGALLGPNAGQGIYDDNALGGWNFSCATGSTNGFRWFDGMPTGGGIAQLACPTGNFSVIGTVQSGGGGYIVPAAATGNSQPSAPVTLNSTGSGGAGVSATINSDSLGNIDLTPASGKAVVATNLTVSGTCTGCSSSTGISGATSGQALIAGSATTATSSKALAGSGAGLTTGPASGVTTLDLPEYIGTGGQQQDSNVPVANVLTIGSRLLTGYSPGTATASATVSIGNLGGSNGNFTQGATNSAMPLMPSAGTISGLYVSCGAVGVSASDGIFTVLKQTSGSGSQATTTMTVTYGTSATANVILADTTHTVSFAAGDRIGIRVVTLGSTTLANCAVTLTY